ncbi:MAG: hypothetical protein ABIR06_19745 [Cyclobacteriaceae bacterium]
MPSLEGIDLARWQEDKNGCNGVRTSMRGAMDKEKTKLLSLGQMQIVELLGRPDKNELLKRNQKFFYYFIQPSEECTGEKNVRSARLVIRFNAVGLAKEVSVE